MGQEKKKLFRLYFDGIYSKAEASEAIDSLSKQEFPDLQRELSNELWEDSLYEAEATTENQQAEYMNEARHLLDRIEQKNKFPRIFLAKIAASVAVLFVLVCAGFYLNNHYFNKETSFATISTSYGEKKRVSLPDGSELVLNSCSSVRIPDDFKSDRKVELDGEAYFKVMADEDHPFVVQTTQMNVSVLGTSFDVKSYAENEVVSVSVETGKVKVELPDAVMTLKADEQLYINSLSGEYNKLKEHNTVADWIRGGLQFRNTPIRDVARELERSYNCQITFKYNQTFENLISGEHDNKSLESVLKSIECTSGIKYKIDGRNVLLYK